jgi:mannose/cellobiose epimerase-like protein (N-acyl-D-glucosamine 2-epimerase family)
MAPDFRSPQFLQDHIAHTMRFYHPRAIDPGGGFDHFFRAEGTVYDRIWTYSWTHFVDHEYGAWYRILGPDNRKLTDEKSPARKTDYHTMGACHDVLDFAVPDQHHAGKAAER